MNGFWRYVGKCTTLADSTKFQISLGDHWRNQDDIFYNFQSKITGTRSRSAM